MKVYPMRNWLVTRSFIKEVLKYCENKPKFIIDKTPWLIKALIWNSNTEGFGKHSLVESVFKQRAKIFFCYITKNPVRCWNLFCRLFMWYYNHLTLC